MEAVNNNCCILCSNVTQPRKRVYFKNLREEPLSTLKELLNKHYVEEEVVRCLKEPVVLCKGPCQRLLKKLAKVKQDLQSLEKNVIEKMAVRFEQREVGEVVSEGPCTPQRNVRIELNTPERDTLSCMIAPETPCISMLQKKGDKHRVHRVSRSLRGVARSVGRKNRKSVVNQVIKDKRMKCIVVKRVGQLVQKELIFTSTKEAKSIYGNKSLEDLTKFSWSLLATDMKRTMPTLSSILGECLLSEEKKAIVIPFIGGVLLKQHNEKMSFLQRLFSLLLYSCHSSKQLYQRLQKVGVSMSHKSTIRYIDSLGSYHDEPVKKWCREVGDIIWKESVVATNGHGDTASLPNEDPIFSDSSNNTNSNDSGSSSLPPLSSINHLLEALSKASSTSSENGDLSESESQPHVTSDRQENVADLTCNQSLPLPSFKIVGDNIDKSVRPREETLDSHRQSLHYFHSYAVKDRTDISALQDNTHLPDLEGLDITKVLPGDDDRILLKRNMTIITARVIRKSFLFFKTNVKPIMPHIPHQFSKEMSMKSEVIPLGVLLKNEIKNEDMVAILSHLQQYVPVRSENEELVDPDDGEVFQLSADYFHYVLFGGDQLTAERATGAKRSKDNENRGIDRLEGLVPVIEDWHAKVCFLKAIWKLLYSTSSGINSGTLFQLRNLLKRRTVTKTIKSDPTACEDFFLLVVKAHILELVMKKLRLNTLDETPSSDSMFGDIFLNCSVAEREDTFMQFVSDIVNDYTHGFEINQHQNEKDQDCVLAYAKELLTLGLLLLEYNDAVREGDGFRILRCWRFLLLVFKATGKRKYSIQAATLLFQYEYLFSERMRHQLLWSRTINVHGKRGKNIAMDLHMEHLNRELKTSISHLGANVAENTIKRVGLCLRQLIEIRNNYDLTTGIQIESGWHTSRSSDRDLNSVLEELRKADVFDNKPNRKHSEVKSFKSNRVGSIKNQDMIIWLKDQLYRLLHR